LQRDHTARTRLGRAHPDRGPHDLRGFQKALRRGIPQEQRRRLGPVEASGPQEDQRKAAVTSGGSRIEDCRTYRDSKHILLTSPIRSKAASRLTMIPSACMATPIKM